jgi:hypothetical protein
MVNIKDDYPLLSSASFYEVLVAPDIPRKQAIKGVLHEGISNNHFQLII